MNEGEKRKILKKYNPDVLPIEVVKGIYEGMVTAHVSETSDGITSNS